MLPFTIDQFLAVFGSYNRAIWPAQILVYGVALTPFALARARGGASASLALALALMWAFTGIVYHWMFFAPLNPAAKGFAAIFVLQAILFAGAARGGLRLDFGRTGPRAWIGWALILYAAIVYPAWALAAHAYPNTPLFGVAPCPLTLFTFGCLLLAAHAPWWLLIAPTLWSLIGGSAAVLLNVPQDWALLASGVATLAAIAATRAKPVARPA